jgi:hypothetical protein
VKRITNQAITTEITAAIQRKASEIAKTCGAFRVTSKRATSFTLSRLRCGPRLQEQSPPPGDLFTRTACPGSAASSHATLTLSIDEDDQVIHPPSAGCQKSGDASPGGDAAPFPIPPIEAIASATTSRRKFLHRERSTFVGCARPGGVVRVSSPLGPPRADAAHVAALRRRRRPAGRNTCWPRVRRFSGREQVRDVLCLSDWIFESVQPIGLCLHDLEPIT